MSTAPATRGQQVLPQGPVGPVRRPGSARLSGPSGCVRGLAAVVVRGRSIARVVFGVDGRVVATVRRADARGRWMTRLASSRLRSGTHRVTATVRFAAASGSRPRTLRLSIARCRPAVVTPHFTG